MHIGILQPGHIPSALYPKTGDYADMFEHMLQSHGFNFSVFDIEGGEFPESTSVCDGWLITGSRHGVYEKHAFLAPLRQFIVDCYAAQRPMVGICFGHQIIAEALGGRVEKFAQGWAVGLQTYQFGQNQLSLNAWHQDQVIEPPSGAISLAHNDFCKHAALLYDKVAFTLQPHPEFDANVIDGLITHRGKGIVPDNLLEKARSSLAQSIDQDLVAQKIAQFFLTGDPL